MKHFIGILALTTSLSAVAVQGYEDIYLDKSQDVIIHGIMCGDDLNNVNKLQPSIVFTNSSEIKVGTYYYQSAYGGHSFSFSKTKSDAVLMRGLLKGGNQSKEDMESQPCIVKFVEGLPEGLKKYLQTVTIKADAEDWTSQMEMYQFGTGKPALGKDKY